MCTKFHWNESLCTNIFIMSTLLSRDQGEWLMLTSAVHSVICSSLIVRDNNNKRLHQDRTLSLSRGSADDIKVSPRSPHGVVGGNTRRYQGVSHKPLETSNTTEKQHYACNFVDKIHPLFWYHLIPTEVYQGIPWNPTGRSNIVHSPTNSVPDGWLTLRENFFLSFKLRCPEQPVVYTRSIATDQTDSLVTIA